LLLPPTERAASRILSNPSRSAARAELTVGSARALVKGQDVDLFYLYLMDIGAFPPLWDLFPPRVSRGRTSPLLRSRPRGGESPRPAKRAPQSKQGLQWET
jgi:hypothetical protein